MAVKYLSDDWARAVTEALNASEDFKKAATGQHAKLQQVVTDAPAGGEIKFYFKLEDGSVEIALGELVDAEATISQSYDTAVAVDKGELNPQNAFMQGKLKISGNMMKLMQLQSVIGAMPRAVSGIEREY